MTVVSYFSSKKSLTLEYVKGAVLINILDRANSNIRLEAPASLNILLRELHHSIPELVTYAFVNVNALDAGTDFTGIKESGYRVFGNNCLDMHIVAHNCCIIPTEFQDAPPECFGTALCNAFSGWG
jgi:hypothetical protein